MYVHHPDKKTRTVPKALTRRGCTRARRTDMQVQGLRKGSCMQGRWLPRLGLGGHDEPYDPLVFALHAMMCLPVSWALELLLTALLPLS